MKITISGAGNWGTTLALLLNGNGHKVTLWEFFRERAERINRDRENKEYLPGYKIPPGIDVTSVAEEASSQMEMIVFAVPSFAVRSTAKIFGPLITRREIIGVTVVKGLEEGTLKPISLTISEEIPILTDVVVLSGPSIAREVVRRVPTTVVAASSGLRKAETVQEVFSNGYFRVYRSQDKRGVELAGALKNIIAIAAGICDGLGLGVNTKAALITRGLAEIKRLGVAMGGDPLTFSGLSGIGDLIVTSFSLFSRNRKVGERIGRGEKLPDILASMTEVAEGVYTTPLALKLAEKFKVEMPITVEMNKVLFVNKSPQEAIRDLMTRRLKKED